MAHKHPFLTLYFTTTTTILLCLLHVGMCSTSVVPTGPCFASRSTWFADNQHGACSYGPSLGPTGNGNYLIAASSMLVFDNSADCGACYQITGANGTSVIVTVVDQCTDPGVCSTTFPHLDLSPQAFDTIADPTVAGVTSTNAMRVACPVTGGVKLSVRSDFFYDNNWEILIFNHRLPITGVTVSFSGNTPIPLTRQTYNYWLYNGVNIVWPATIVVTDVNGDEVVFQPLSFTPGMLVEANDQFAVPQPYPNTPQKCPAPLTVDTSGWIYEDSLTQQYASIDYINVFQWLDYSYNADIDWSCTDDVYAGSYCVQAALDAYGGLQLGQSYSFSWAGLFTDLQFAVRGDSPYSNGLTVGFKGAKTIAVDVTTEWQLFTLSLDSDLAAPATLGGQTTLLFANTKSAASPTLYFDNIRLLPVSSTTTTPTQSPTITPTTAPNTPQAPTTTTTKSPTTTTTTTTTPTPTTTTTKTTTVTTTTTAAPTPITPPTTNSCDGVSVNQTISGSWTDSYFHGIYIITVTNSGQATASNVVISITPAGDFTIEQNWGLTQLLVANTYLLSFEVPASQSYSGSGYITGSAAANVALVC